MVWILIILSVASCSGEGLQRHQFLALDPRFLPGGASEGGFYTHCGKPRGGVWGRWAAPHTCPPPYHQHWLGPDHFQGDPGDINAKLAVKHGLAGVEYTSIRSFRGALKGRWKTISKFKFSNLFCSEAEGEGCELKQQLQWEGTCYRLWVSLYLTKITEGEAISKAQRTCWNLLNTVQGKWKLHKSTIALGGETYLMSITALKRCNTYI